MHYVKMEMQNLLQGLRALAIAAVVSYNLDPKKFPYGNVAIDIYFIFTGCITGILLRKEKIESLTETAKNIAKIYFTVISFFCVIGFFFVSPFNFSFLKDEILCSTFFIKSLCSFQIPDAAFFLWVIGIEAQFILIGPFMSKYFSTEKKPLILILLLWTALFLLSLFFSSNQILHKSILCRCLQLSTGIIIAFYVSQRQKNSGFLMQRLIDKETNNVTYKNYGPPKALLSALVKFVLTITSQIHKATKYYFRFCPPIVALFPLAKNISYIFFLIHWPIIVFFKILLLIESIYVFLTILSFSIFVYSLLNFKILSKKSICGTTIFYSIMLILSINGLKETIPKVIQNHHNCSNNAFHKFQNLTEYIHQHEMCINQYAPKVTLDSFKMGRFGEHKYFLPLNPFFDQSECNWLTLGIGGDLLVEKMFKQKYPGCSVFGVEPSPDQYEGFEKYGTVIPHGVAVTPGTFELTLRKGKEYVKQQISVLSLADLLDKYLKTRTVLYMTIDIEGFEYSILKELVIGRVLYEQGITICQIDAELHGFDENLQDMKFVLNLFDSPQSQYFPFITKDFHIHRKISFINFRNLFCRKAFDLSSVFS